jgi:hypothetical protein
VYYLDELEGNPPLSNKSRGCRIVHFVLGHQKVHNESNTEIVDVPRQNEHLLVLFNARLYFAGDLVGRLYESLVEILLIIIQYLVLYLFAFRIAFFDICFHWRQILFFIGSIFFIDIT